MTLALACYLTLSPGFANPPRSKRSPSTATSSPPAATSVLKTSKKVPNRSPKNTRASWRR